MSKRPFVIALTLTTCLAGGVRAEEKPKAPEKAKPTAEHKKLAYFVGKWKSEGDVKPGPMGAGGKFNGIDKCAWFAGGFAVICDGNGTSPTGELKGHGILSYRPDDKKYTYFGVDNMGMAEVAMGSLDGDTWTYNSEGSMGGKAYKGRYTIKQEGPDAYAFKWEMSEDGTNWMTVMDGKETRVKAEAKKEEPKK